MTALSEAFGVRVPVRADTDDFDRDLRRKLSKVDASKSGKQVATRFGVGMHGAIGGIVSKSAGIFAAGFAAVKTVQVFGGFINDARESEKVSRITANAIRATGGAAKISADDVGKLATAISNKTAIDDEQIQTAANMLLTFKNIRNEAGKGNDIFNQATQAAADLSVQFGGMDGASKQLGKALNDPIKGTTALAKAGVTFTQQQKDQIKTLVESGNVLGAQKIILGEIQGQVGGAAAAAADPMERLKVIAGNLGESIGGLLLPTVNKFANFISDEVVPGLSAFAAAFKANDGDITSSGFPGFMERLGFAARGVFDYFKTNVLPRLREFAGFVRDEVVPRIVALATYLAQNLGPVVKDFVETRLAALRKIFDDVKQSIADNRPQLEQLGTAIKNVAKFVIEQLIPFLSKVSSTTMPVLGAAIRTAITTISGIVTAFNAIKEPIRLALKFVTDKFLGVVETILDGAAKAFGWVPNLGDKLKNAAADFKKFRDDVNRALDGVDDERISITPFINTKALTAAKVNAGRMAIGGKVTGPGGPTDDRAGLYALSDQEWVIQARSSMKYGDRAMKAVNAGRAVIIPDGGFAAGGRPGLNVSTHFPNTGLLAREVAAHTAVVAKPFAQAIVNKLMGPGGPPGSVRSFRGERLNERTIRMLLSAERMLGATFRIMQGSYSTRVAASGGTHSGGGAMDTNGPRGWNAAVSALRRAGFAAWHRTPAQGPWGHHIHSIAIGDSSASPSAKRQVQSFLRGGNGLGGLADGGRVKSFDSGGKWKTGTLGYNGSGKTETVIADGQELHLSDRSIRRLAEAMTGRSMRIETRGGQQFATLLPSNG